MEKTFPGQKGHPLSRVNLKGHSQLWDRADLDTTFASLESLYLTPKSNARVGYI